MVRWAFAAAALLVVASCATVPPAQREKRVERLIAELNTADESRLMELSARPFLLDGEIILLEDNLRTLWANLRAVGFTFAEAEIVSISPLDGTSYRRFGDTMDVRAFFQKYASSDGALVQLRTGHGDFLIITGGRVGRVPRIFGFTGPGGL